MRKVPRIPFGSLVCILVIITGYSRSYGAWYGTVENLCTETFSDVAIAYNKHSWPLYELSAPDTAALIAFTGRMPDTVDMSLTSGDGVHHTLHTVLPAPPSPSMRICLVIKDHNTVVATYTDPMMESLRLWTFSLRNHSGPALSKVVASCNGQSWVLDSTTIPADGPLFECPSNRTIWGVVLPKDFDLIITTRDGKEQKIHLVLPPLTEMDSDTPTIHIIIKGPDEATACFIDSDEKTPPYWFYTIENRSGDEVSEVEVRWRDDLLPHRAPGYMLSGKIARTGDGCPLPKIMEVGYATKTRPWRLQRVVVHAVDDMGTPTVHLVIEKSGTVTATGKEKGVVISE